MALLSIRADRDPAKDGCQAIGCRLSHSADTAVLTTRLSIIFLEKKKTHCQEIGFYGQKERETQGSEKQEGDPSTVRVA